MLKKINIKVKLFIIVLLCGYKINSQVVTTYPTFPTQNDSIVVYFDATSTPLKDYTGDVYTHTGLITNKSINSGDWKNVIGTWGNNTIQPKLEKIESKKYRLIIGNIKKYYNVINNDKILKLAFVFRSADGKIQTSNIYVDLFEQQSNIKISSPSVKPFIIKINENFEVKIEKSNIDEVHLFINDELKQKFSNDVFTYNQLFSSKGKYKILVKGYLNGSVIAKDSVIVYTRAENNIASLPANTKYGINYINDNTVILALYAPKKNYAFVIGDFNDWEINENYQMNVTADGTTFWMTLNNLSPKTEYGFQYFVDGGIRIADPYADKILDPWNDKYITNATYPNLKQYPEGKTEEIVSVLETGQDAFVWTATNYIRPAKEKLVIYELLIRDFIKEHTYKAVIDSLDYLQRLGVNAIELMPVNEFEGNSSWGYNPSFYFAPDKYYGHKNDLKKLIDECHKRGMVVLLDLVLNHSYGQSPFVRLYFENGKPASDNPWYNVNHNFTNTDAQWGYDFNHESLKTQELIDRINKYWMEEYKIDGFRFDFTKGFGNNIKSSNDSWGSLYDADRIRLLKRMTDKIWQFNPNAYVIFEHLADNQEEKELADYGIMLWGNSNHTYSEASMGFHDNNKSNFNNISYKQKNWNNPHLVGYMESHDEERIMYRNILYGNSASGYNIQNLETALARIKMAAAFFFTIPGPKMIWQFGELGYDISINDGGRLSEKPIKWDYYQNPLRKELYKVFAELIKLKKNYSVFSTDNFVMNVNGKTKYVNLTHPDMNAVIFGNFDVTKQTVNLMYQETGKWYDFFSGDSLIISTNSQAILLEPGQFHIHTTKKLHTPEKGILTNIKEEKTIVDKYQLEQNYPNPFNPSTEINYSIPEQGYVSIKVYDILGRQVAELVNEEKQAGTYKIKFDTQKYSLSSGIYIYRIQSNQFVQSKKMMLIK